MTRILDKEHSLLGRFMSELRDQQIQRDPMRFRRNLERVGEVMAYELSKTLDHSSHRVTTPLGQADIMLNDDRIVLVPILRSGIPMMNGFLNYFDHAAVGFVSAHRHYRKNGEMEIRIEQITTPSLEDAILIIIDPMLATGSSVEMAYEALINKAGSPKHTHICAAISSADGIAEVDRSLGKGRVTIWSASVDSEMTVKSYIVPGIGDTGDLAYGDKL